MPNLDWILGLKIHDLNRELMRIKIESFERKVVDIVGFESWTVWFSPRCPGSLQPETSQLVQNWQSGHEMLRLTADCCSLVLCLFLKWPPLLDECGASHSSKEYRAEFMSPGTSIQDGLSSRLGAH